MKIADVAEAATALHVRSDLQEALESLRHAASVTIEARLSVGRSTPIRRTIEFGGFGSQTAVSALKEALSAELAGVEARLQQIGVDLT